MSEIRSIDREARAPLATIVLLLLAAVLYAAMMGCLTDAPYSDAAGRGLALVFATILGIGLWLVLAGLLMVAAHHGHMPGWAQLAFVLLVPLSAVAAQIAGDAYGHGDASALLLPALLPPLIVLYALWARFPRLQAVLRGGVAGALLCLAILGLSLVPVVSAIRASSPDPAREARFLEQGKQVSAERERENREARAREEAQFEALGPEAKLGDYLPWLHTRFADEALMSIQRSRTRQVDVFPLLRSKPLVELRDLWQFNLTPSTNLCRAYGTAFTAAAGHVTKTESNYLGNALDFELQLPNIKWLLRGGCDLRQPLSVLEANVRAVADSERMENFADTLEDLRGFNGK